MRLIDADRLLKDIADFPYGYRGMIKAVIANQPTIYPPAGYRVLPDGDGWEYRGVCTASDYEEVYDQYSDTAGNLHWTGTHSGKHTIKAEESKR